MLSHQFIPVSVNLGESTGGLLLHTSADRHLGVPLQYTFETVQEAHLFGQSAERVGVNLYPGMPREELSQLVLLWRDGIKRGENKAK